MELLRHTIDMAHVVVQTTFSAGEHTVLKEVITDSSYDRPGAPAAAKRVSFRLHLDARQLERLPAGQLLAKTKSYPTLSALCNAFGIDPACAARGLATPAPKPQRTTNRGAHGRFTPPTPLRHA